MNTNTPILPVTVALMPLGDRTIDRAFSYLVDSAGNTFAKKSIDGKLITKTFLNNDDAVFYAKYMNGDIERNFYQQARFRALNG